MDDSQAAVGESWLPNVLKMLKNSDWLKYAMHIFIYFLVCWRFLSEGPDGSDHFAGDANGFFQP